MLLLEREVGIGRGADAGGVVHERDDECGGVVDNASASGSTPSFGLCNFGEKTCIKKYRSEIAYNSWINKQVSVRVTCNINASPFLFFPRTSVRGNDLEEFSGTSFAYLARSIFACLIMIWVL